MFRSLIPYFLRDQNCYGLYLVPEDHKVVAPTISDYNLYMYLFVDLKQNTKFKDLTERFPFPKSLPGLTWMTCLWRDGAVGSAVYGKPSGERKMTSRDKPKMRPSTVRTGLTQRVTYTRLTCKWILVLQIQTYFGE